MKRSVIVTLTAISLVLSFAGVATGSSPTDAHRRHQALPLVAAAAVEIRDNSFVPAALTVATGTAVTWTNRGTLAHTVVGVGPGSGRIAPGGTYTVTFDAPGNYSYVCDVHAGMAGSVVVGVPAPSPGTVDMIGNVFSPAAVTIAVGDTLTFVNRDARPHTVTASDGAFDSGYVFAGSSWSFKATTPGTFVFHCEIHTGMAGTLTITGTAAAPPPASGGAAVAMTENVFTPATLTVPVGATVTWRNAGGVRHTATRAGSFDSGLLPAGGTFSFSFAAPGTYAYLCELHGGMSGTIVVGAGGALPTPTPTPIPTASISQASATSARVSMADDVFLPAALDVTAGTTVTWVNDGKAKHTVTFEGGPSSDLVAAGASYTRTFTDPGTYRYLCALHPGMKGVVTVRAAASAASVTARPPGETVAPAVPALLAPRAAIGVIEALVLGLAVGVLAAFVLGGLLIVASMERSNAA